MRDPLLLIASVCALLTAGCVGSDEAATDPNDGSQAPVPTPVHRFHLAGETFASAVGVQFLADVNLLEVPVGTNATRIYANLTWSSAGGSGDLDVAVSAPGACEAASPADPAQALCHTNAQRRQPSPGWFQNMGGTMGAPDSPSRLVLERDVIAGVGCDEDECTWEAFPVVVFVAATIAWDLTVEVQYSPAAPGA